MTKIEFERIKKTEKLVFYFLRDFELVLVSILALTCFITFVCLSIREATFPSLFFTFLFFIFCLYLYSSARNRFTFKRIYFNNQLDFDFLVDLMGKEEWAVKLKVGSFANVYTGVRPFSWGEELTLVFCEDYVLFNNCPCRGRPFYTYGDLLIEKKIRDIISESSKVIVN